MTTTHHIIGAAHQSSDEATNIRIRPVRGWSLAARLSVPQARVAGASPAETTAHSVSASASVTAHRLDHFTDTALDLGV